MARGRLRRSSGRFSKRRKRMPAFDFPLLFLSFLVRSSMSRNGELIFIEEFRIKCLDFFLLLRSNFIGSHSSTTLFVSLLTSSVFLVFPIIWIWDRSLPRIEKSSWPVSGFIRSSESAGHWMKKPSDPRPGGLRCSSVTQRPGHGSYDPGGQPDAGREERAQEAQSERSFQPLGFLIPSM